MVKHYPFQIWILDFFERPILTYSYRFIEVFQALIIGYQVLTLFRKDFVLQSLYLPTFHLLHWAIFSTHRYVQPILWIFQLSLWDLLSFCPKAPILAAFQLKLRLIEFLDFLLPHCFQVVWRVVGFVSLFL